MEVKISLPKGQRGYELYCEVTAICIACKHSNIPELIDIFYKEVEGELVLKTQEELNMDDLRRGMGIFLEIYPLDKETISIFLSCVEGDNGIRMDKAQNLDPSKIIEYVKLVVDEVLRVHIPKLVI